MEILMGIFLGLLPESLYYGLFLIFAKNIKYKRVLLIAIIFLSNFLIKIFIPFMLWGVLIFIALMYLTLWLLYRSHFIDVFLITVAGIISVIVGTIVFYAIPNEILGWLLGWISLFACVTVFKKHINKLYKVYLSVWDKSDNPKIKSVTVRNISCVMFNILLIAVQLIIPITMIERGV